MAMADEKEHTSECKKIIQYCGHQLDVLLEDGIQIVLDEKDDDVSVGKLSTFILIYSYN
jgi:hypothetical protein